MARNHTKSDTEHPEIFLTIWDVSLIIRFAIESDLSIISFANNCPYIA